MMSSASREADTPPPTPPLSEKLARRLLSSEAGNHPSPEELAAVTAEAYTRLRARLAVFLGEQGFDALWRRAIQLARREFHAWDDAAGEEPSATLPPGLHGAVRGGDAAEAHARLIAAFASFIALLFTFIGEDLGVRLIYQAWPDLPPDAADAHAEGATQ
jgi:hypothetical protein